ncbi:MAG: FecR domain-containing protein [Opitutaceae bacterium]
MTTSEQIEAAAADWLARRKTEPKLSNAAEFQRWLSADPRHVAAYQELESVWKTISYEDAPAQIDVALARLSSRSRKRLRRRQSIGWAVAAVVAIGFFAAPFHSRWTNSEKTIDSSITVLAPNREVLSDGSVVELKSGARIAVAYTANRRRVTLLSGEAHFAVMKDSGRPFVVAAGTIEVRAVGTEFTVRYDKSLVDVLVTEGKVALKRGSDGANLLRLNSTSGEAGGGSHLVLEPPVLSAGQRAQITDLFRAAGRSSPTVSLSVVSASGMASALAWRHKCVEFTRTPLSEAVEFFNRQNDIKLTISDPVIASLPINGNLSADDPEGFVRLLVQGFDLHSVRSGQVIDLRAAGK